MIDYIMEMYNIKKSYKDGETSQTVIENVNLTLKPGEFVAIVGPSGSGKSTLLSIAGALLTPDNGLVRIGETVISRKNQKNHTKLRREKIGFIYQSHQLLPFLTIEEQLKMITKMGKKTKDPKMNITTLLEDLGLTSCQKKYPENMSGGEKQRAAIARAFMNDPDVILADEPTASLDGERGRQIVNMIQREVKKYNKAAIMVTHDERVLDLVDVVYRIKDKTLVLDEKFKNSEYLK